LKRPFGGRDSDELVGQVLEMVEGVYAVLAFAVIGALMGIGAAALLDLNYWIGLGVGALVLPAAVILLARAAGREADR
jgi:protein involved in temperature-dependent protein secretion